MTIELSPVPVQRFVDSNGAALSGGKLFSYSAGTTAKLATYTDSTGATPNLNPIILNTRGECSIWLPSEVAYKFVLSPSSDSDPPTNPIWTVDNIVGPLAADHVWTATNIAYTRPIAGALPTTVAAQLNSSALMPEDFGAVGNGVADDTAAMVAWFAALRVTPLIGLLRGIYKCSAPLTWDLAGAAVHVVGAGSAAIDLRTVPNAIALEISASGQTAYTSSFRSFRILSNNAGATLQLGSGDFSDTLISFVFDNITVENDNNSASAIALSINNVQNSHLSIVVSVGAGGKGVSCQQAQDCVLELAITGGAIGIDYGVGLSSSNVWICGINSAVDVQTDVVSVFNETFIGGSFTWTGASMVVANLGTGLIEFINPHIVSVGTTVTGAAAAIVRIDDNSIGTGTFGAVTVNPATGDAVLTMNSITGQADRIALERAGLLRWLIYKDNVAEGGANAGSNFGIGRYNDAGTAIDVPLAINRATGVVSHNNLALLPQTFASLPAAPGDGAMAHITDSTVNTWGTTIAGGGANSVLAWYNGTNWTVIGA